MQGLLMLLLHSILTIHWADFLVCWVPVGPQDVNHIKIELNRIKMSIARLAVMTMCSSFLQHMTLSTAKGPHISQAWLAHNHT